MGKKSLDMLKWHRKAWCLVGDLFFNIGLGDMILLFNWVMTI
jgi:hypothetical protein